MKKCWIFVVLAIFLTGCGAQQTFETVSDDHVQSVAVMMQQMQLELPENASVMTLSNKETGTLYLCDGYTVTTQTIEAGDLERTLMSSTGFTSQGLQLLQTDAGEIDRYECVWVAAGETGSQVCRGCILDDGNYHYVVTIIGDSADAGKLNDQWQRIMQSVKLTSE